MVDFSLGNWLALNGGAEEVDRWNKLVAEVQALQAERDQCRQELDGVLKMIGDVREGQDGQSRK